MFLNEIVHCSLTSCSWVWMSNGTALWSEIRKSVMLILVGVMSAQQIKSSMWPLLWVGRCCAIQRQSRSDVKSKQRYWMGCRC